MDHISFMWLIVFSFVTFKFTKIVSIYWFNLKYTYTLFISCTIKSVYEVGPNLFLVKFSNVHCWLVLNFLCCQGLGDQRNWESTCKVKSKVSWNQIWPAVITYRCTLYTSPNPLAFSKIKSKKYGTDTQTRSTYNNDVRNREKKHEGTGIVEFMGHPVLMRLLEEKS